MEIPLLSLSGIWTTPGIWLWELWDWPAGETGSVKCLHPAGADSCLSILIPSPFPVLVEADNKMGFVLRYGPHKIFLHLQTFWGGERNLYDNWLLVGKWLPPTARWKAILSGPGAISGSGRHLRCPWRLIRHSTPILNTCLIKTLMLPF